MSEYIVGVDLGATKILTGIATSDGKILYKEKLPTWSERGAGDILDRLCCSIKHVVSQAGITSKQVIGIAVATPGPLSYPDAVVRNSPNLNWDYIPFKAELSKSLDTDVIVEKDTNMAVLGEYYFGRKCRYKQMLYITVSTGIGGGIITEGQVYHGANGGAGEIGHMVVEPDGPLCGCGRRGCLEAMVSGSAIAKEIKGLIAQGKGRGILACCENENKEIGAREVGIAARKGDPEAVEIIDNIVKYLGTGISNLVNIINPEIVVLGGGVALGLQDLILEPTFAYVRKQVFSLHQEVLKLEVSSLGEDIGLFGCIAAVLQKLS